MTTDRITRVNELLRREIAGLLPRIVGHSGLDLAAVTVTHVITTADLRQARVLVSIRDHEDERDRMIVKLRRHRGEIQQHINRTLTLRYTPKLHFELDASIEQGDHVLNLLLDMEREGENEPNTGDGAEDAFPETLEQP